MTGGATDRLLDVRIRAASAPRKWDEAARRKREAFIRPACRSLSHPKSTPEGIGRTRHPKTSIQCAAHDRHISHFALRMDL